MLSIERYLNAPLVDEPASVPAISAALKWPTSESGAVLVEGRRHHSRESSFDVNSDGRRTFYTSGSAAESTGTSYSTVSKSNLHRSMTRLDAPELPQIETVDYENARVTSPERPATSRTLNMERPWAEQMEQFMSSYSPDSTTDYRLKAEEETAGIQENARAWENRMHQYDTENETLDPPAPEITDEMAYARMAAQPKLAWVLGGDLTDAKSIERPKSYGSALTDAPEDSIERGSARGRRSEIAQTKVSGKHNSTATLDDKTRGATFEKRCAGIFARRPSIRPRFYCTFCQKRFCDRLEWMRHEQTLHMPEELYVCCPRTGQFPAKCPFCAKSNPSPSHLADHNYLSCQEKPLSERTYDRQDYFLQHISQVHKVTPSQKPLRLTELAEAWKNPLPLKLGHQALHCGFCGKTFTTYKERTEHVGVHFMQGMDMMSWWPARVSHEMEPCSPDMTQNADLPHKCLYCERTYESLAVAQKLHPVCKMWSCSFLQGMQYTIYPAGTREALEAACCYCNDTLVRGAGKVKGSVLKEHINQHNFRKCSQRLYFSGQRFRQHLQDSHKANFDGTLSAGWTLLLKSSKKEKPPMFDPIDPSVTAVRRTYTDPASSDSTPAHKKKDSKAVNVYRTNFMDLSVTEATPRPPTPKKLRRKASAQAIPDPKQHSPPPIPTTLDFAPNAPIPSSPRTSSTHTTPLSPSPTPAPPPRHRPGFPVSSLPCDAVAQCPLFYRRRLDASTRNRLYMRDREAGMLSKKTQKMYRRVPGSLLGGALHNNATQ
ncbi:hypothetical protein BDV95DRAFT_596522 [Massariosphaeria phaeospora]|uniref:C2H2-type domain-containing protein n=1 Tax=Massariosphaeria phaeospora TaxID=100035 RepID=A0A7C8I7W3_9PLEO|nr:hypothetical protein BDV95DRAFT_596522 [Massariosphaeria phaeospora]